MNKTRFSIIMDYQNAVRQAEILDSVVKDLEKNERDEQAFIDGLRISWTGENAEIFLKKLEISKNNVSKIKQMLSETSVAIKRIAKRTYDTEMATLEISMRRTYKN